MKRIFLVGCLVLLASMAARGSELAGVWVLEGPSSGLTLELDASTDGGLRGKLSSSTGAQYAVEGVLEEGTAVGMAYDAAGAAYFEARAQGATLLFTLMEPDSTGMPDPGRAQTLRFARPEPGVPLHSRPGVPSAHSSAAVAAAGTGSDLARAMAGRYWGYEGSTEREYHLCPDGRYYGSRESSYSGQSFDSLGNQTLAWGASGRADAVGRFQVQGSLQQGTITLIEPDGSSDSIAFRAVDRDCWDFEGATLCRAGPPSCP